MKARVFIGTSGFSYPHWGNEVFYPKGLSQRDWFLYYVKHFDTVELNVSFYRLPKKETFIGWRRKAGPKFVFSVKGSRFITHVKKLKDCQEPINTFFENADGLLTSEVKPSSNIENTSEVVLWQLPPRFKANPERLKLFLKILPKNFRHAFEFREASWLDDKIYKILKKHNATVVFQDFPGWPITEEITADFVYLRFHGKTHLYTSCYTEKELIKWARKIKDWKKKGLDCYAYFNNDALGYAIENAKQLKRQLK